MARRKADRAELEGRLGHRFADGDLLETALTHVSAGGGGRSYQRLEFLGDRVLGLAVAAMLMRAFPEASEGELSQRLSKLVRRESCAAMAEAWDVASHLRLGSGEARTGGRRNQAILSDVAEAIIGAVYLDAGVAPAIALVERSLGRAIGADATPFRDAKTALQEWAQGSGRPIPVYALVARSGPDHAPRFEVSAQVTGVAAATGVGASKRVAEQNAAETLLRREGVWARPQESEPEPKPLPKPKPKPEPLPHPVAESQNA